VSIPMSSLQSRLLSLMLRWRFKRRPSPDDDEFVRVARRLMNDPRLIPRHVPADLTLEASGRPGVRGEWVTPTDPRATVVYFHGGGYIGGSVETYRRTTFALARAARSRVFAVEYRLAPEHRFPCAVEDGLAAYRYVLGEGSDAGDIAFVGDSAGGGLLLATMLAARDEGLPLPSAAVCYSPLTDLAATGGSLDANDRRCVMFYGDTLRRCAPIYLGGADARAPLASPLYANLAGLPPLQIFVSSSETLLDDARRLAEKARADGVSVDLQVWKNLPHVWPIFARQLPEARRALRLTAEFVSRASSVRQAEKEEG
jgi:monoterpene epsilon-lactone hydrolase